MRVAVLLFVATLASAAPVPKASEKPSLVLTLKSVSADGPSLLGGCIALQLTNTTKKQFTLKYAHLPINAFTFEVRDAEGKVIPYKHPIALLLPNSPQSKTLTLDAGKSITLRFGLDAWQFDNNRRPLGKLTVVAMLKHDEKMYESKPLIVE